MAKKLTPKQEEHWDKFGPGAEHMKDIAKEDAITPAATPTFANDKTIKEALQESGVSAPEGSPPHSVFGPQQPQAAATPPDPMQGSGPPPNFTAPPTPPPAAAQPVPPPIQAPPVQPPPPPIMAPPVQPAAAAAAAPATAATATAAATAAMAASPMMGAILGSGGGLTGMAGGAIGAAVGGVPGAIIGSQLGKMAGSAIAALGPQPNVQSDPGGNQTLLDQGRPATGDFGGGEIARFLRSIEQNTRSVVNDGIRIREASVQIGGKI